MVAIKAPQADRFVRNPDKNCAAVLLHGPDPGLVSERAGLVARALAARDADGGEIIRIEDADLETDTGRLVIELQTVPMFGGGKVVRSSASRRINASLLKDIFADGPPAAAFVCEAGNLKATDALRKLFEATSWAASIACYSDSERDLASLAREMVESAGLKLGQDVVDVLVTRLGADRALSRGEIDKLILYCAGKTSVEIEDVEAIVGDATESTMDGAVIAAAAGEPERVAREFDRAVNAGENPQVIIGAAQRYFLRLHRVRAGIDAGRSAEDVLRSMRPPVHFKQKDALMAQCRLWSSAALAEAAQRIASTARTARLAGGMDAMLAERLLLNLAVHAARQRERRRA